MIIVFLFDIDGVLVQPFGYRHAMRSTLSFYYHQMGLPSLFLPEEDEIGYFEAHRITSEWDMIPICLAGVLDQALQIDSPIFETLSHALVWIKTNQPHLSRLDYRTLIADCARLHTHQDALADRLMESMKSTASCQPFVNLARQPFIGAVLGNTRNFEINEVTRTFQNHVLGGTIFRRLYPQLPSLPLPSSLDEFDRPQINPFDQHLLSTLIGLGKVKSAAMTLRPNLYPNGNTNGHQNTAGFSPEAELAVRLTSLDSLPVAGYGTLLFLAQLYNLSIDQIIKPSPLHALAGIFLALQNSPESLELAFQCYQHACRSESTPDMQPDRFPYNLFGESLQLHIFEDSPNGIQSVIEAVKILRLHEIRVEVHAWGISTHSDKRIALQRLGAVVTPTTDEALHLAFQKVLA